MKAKPNLDKSEEDYINNAKDSNVSIKKQTEPYIKKTYCISQDHIDWVDSMAYFEKMDKSEIVRKALESFIPEKYKNPIK